MKGEAGGGVKERKARRRCRCRCKVQVAERWKEKSELAAALPSKRYFLSLFWKRFRRAATSRENAAAKPH